MAFGFCIWLCRTDVTFSDIKIADDALQTGVELIDNNDNTIADPGNKEEEWAGETDAGSSLFNTRAKWLRSNNTESNWENLLILVYLNIHYWHQITRWSPTDINKPDTKWQNPASEAFKYTGCVTKNVYKYDYCNKLADTWHRNVLIIVVYKYYSSRLDNHFNQQPSNEFFLSNILFVFACPQTFVCVTQKRSLIWKVLKTKLYHYSY